MNIFLADRQSFSARNCYEALLYNKETIDKRFLKEVEEVAKELE
jgi:hypothetical protein